MSPTQRNLTKPQPSYHPLGVFLNLGQTLTCKASDTQASRSEPNETLALIHRAITMACEKLAETDWVHSLPFQRFQALLTLFSKSFSSFPHGTCLLSVSNLYLALDEIYHPLCAPFPRNVTLRLRTVYEGLQAIEGAITLIGALFQGAYTCAFDGNASQDYNSRPEAPIFMLSCSLFIRHY